MPLTTTSVPRDLRRLGITIVSLFLYLICFLGPEPDAGPPAARAGQRGQGAGQLVHHGAQDEGDLPHAEPLQHGRHQEVPHRRVLGAHRRPAERAEGFS